MTENTTENPNEHCGGKSELIGLVMREGYCCDCDNNPSEAIPVAAAIEGNKCSGCWFNDDKPNWASKNKKQYYTDDGVLMNADGTRSIFDDVDA